MLLEVLFMWKWLEAMFASKLTFFSVVFEIFLEWKWLRATFTYFGIIGFSCSTWFWTRSWTRWWLLFIYLFTFIIFFIKQINNWRWWFRWWNNHFNFVVLRFFRTRACRNISNRRWRSGSSRYRKIKNCRAQTRSWTRSWMSSWMRSWTRSMAIIWYITN